MKRDYIITKILIVAFLIVLTQTKDSTYYDLLRVSQNANEKQIKKAFRQLSKKYHPDKNQDPDAEKYYSQITNAYETLSDQKKREDYDYQLKYGVNGGNYYRQQKRRNSFFFDEDEFQQNFQRGNQRRTYTFTFNSQEDSQDSLNPFERFLPSFSQLIIFSFIYIFFFIVHKFYESNFLNNANNKNFNQTPQQRNQQYYQQTTKPYNQRDFQENNTKKQ